VRAQLAGASIQALGGTMFEELAYGDDGQPLSTTFIDYLIPTATEAPRVEVHVFETAAAPGNPLGAKGVGEAGMIGVPGAIANAVADAIGAPGTSLLSLPLKPGTIFEALDAAR
jgi:aerobic carbon-monoxide dehydrogenase large subunit